MFRESPVGKAVNSPMVFVMIYLLTSAFVVDVVVVQEIFLFQVYAS